MGKGLVIIVTSLLIIVLGAVNWAGSAGAQESTPPAQAAETEVAPGVAFTLLPASEDPPSLYRLTFAPDAALYFAGDPAISLVFVESGAIALNMNAVVSDARAATPAGDTAALAMDQGDYFVLPPLVVGEIRNDGDAPASIVVSAITPGLIPAPTASTPTTG